MLKPTPRDLTPDFKPLDKIPKETLAKLFETVPETTPLGQVLHSGPATSLIGNEYLGG